MGGFNKTNLQYKGSMKNNEMRCADALVVLLEKNGVKHVFGHPGEQILPFYDALRTSKVQHVLMRHEQGAAHAADGYARSSGSMGVCLATAGPGALNLTMGVATAYKDSVPLLVITGDVPRKLRSKNVFQDINTCKVLEPITLQTFDAKNPEEAINGLKTAFKIFENGLTGPIHLNLPKDVLEEPVNLSSVEEDLKEEVTGKFSAMFPSEKAVSVCVADAFEILESSQRPLILAGAGVIWAGAVSSLRNFAEKHGIPVATTYPARGVLPEDHSLCLGMMGTRGTEASNFAGKNCDTLLALGCRLSERTLHGIGKGKVIHVNTDDGVLKGDLNIYGNVSEFLEASSTLKIHDTAEWILRILEHPKDYSVQTDQNDVPLKPQRAVKEIMDASNDLNASGNLIMVNDAGTHTTWVTLLKKVKEPGTLLFSGGFGPMGYGVPAAVGAAFANPDKTVVVVVGDGGFQMTLQELATISQHNLKVVICIINNSSLGIIKQWQKLYYEGLYEVELENPDFLEIARAYRINFERVDSPGEVFRAVKRAFKEMPYLIEVIVDAEEGIPLPKVIK
jgi:acetolactate synthase-1/2/3 large subunit